MPIYEYRCQSCGHELEKLQKLSDPPLADCPDCRKPELKKQISAAGFRLKGSGWYETDFKKDRKRNIAGEHDGGAKKEGSGSGDSASSPKKDSGTPAGSSASSKSEASGKSGSAGEAA